MLLVPLLNHHVSMSECCMLAKNETEKLASTVYATRLLLVDLSFILSVQLTCMHGCNTFSHMHIYTRTCTHTTKKAHSHKHTCMHPHTLTHIHIHDHKDTLVYTYMHMCEHTHTHTHTPHTHASTHMHTHSHKSILTYTHNAQICTSTILLSSSLFRSCSLALSV